MQHHIAISAVVAIASFSVMGLPAIISAGGNWSHVAEAQSSDPRPTYLIRINPGSTEDASQHYVPDRVSVPAGTTIRWIHNDLGAIHTVTSGVPGSMDTGSRFDSGDMRFGATFDLTFDNSTGLIGDVPYYCTVHPWITGMISANTTVATGDYFKMASGSGSLLEVGKSNHTIFTFIPLVPEDQGTSSSAYPSNPISYNLTLLNASNETRFSDQFQVPEQNLQVEFIQTGNDTSVPEEAPVITHDSGGFHVEGNIFNEPGNYTFVVQLGSVGSTRPQQDVTDEFPISVVSRTDAIGSEQP